MSKTQSYLIIENSIFYENILLNDPGLEQNGIINVKYGANLEIFNSTFTRNYLDAPSNPNDETSIIYYGGRKLEFISVLHLKDSLFSENEGMTNSLVSGGFLTEEIKYSNNFEKENKFTKKKTCSGIRGKIEGQNKWAKCIIQFESISQPSASPKPTILSPLSTFLPTPQPKKTCWGNDFTERVMHQEEKIIDTSIPRTYRMCAGTVLNIANYDYDTSEYEGEGVKALSLWNPNVNILCGDDGNSRDCTFSGGTVQIDIYPANEVDGNYTTTLENIKIRGITFIEVNGVNIVIYSPLVKYGEIGASITIQDCVFRVSQINQSII